MANSVLLKLILIGDSTVGKTCTMLRFTKDTFQPNYKSTIGIDFGMKTVQIDEKKLKVQIWDTAGQERFRTITNSYYRGADGIILVYDVTNRKSFDNIYKWLEKIEQCVGDNVHKILIGNKCDDDDRRVVSKESGELLAMEYGMQFLEASAKCNINIEEAFNSIITDILDYKSSEEDDKKQYVKITSCKRNSSRNCC